VTATRDLSTAKPLGQQVFGATSFRGNKPFVVVGRWQWDTKIKIVHRPVRGDTDQCAGVGAGSVGAFLASHKGMIKAADRADRA